jgi:hypothetical protein
MEGMMKKVLSRVAVLVVITAYLFTTPGALPVEGATYTVTNTNSVGSGSLNRAIQDANDNPGLDTIDFNIPGCSGACTILLSTPLPQINDPVIIDGLTQPGATAGDLWAGTGHTLLIELDGSSIPSAADGLSIYAGGSTVRGLVIHSFGGYGIFMATAGNNLIETNYIGTDVAGESDLGNSISGIMLQDSGSNTIGGSLSGAGNLISGNGQSGIYIQGVTSVSNDIQGNFIGTAKDGEDKIENGQKGVVLDNAPWNVVGGSAVEERNLISGNANSGVWIAGTDSYSNRVRGNYIGTNRHGTATPTALGNGADGVYIVDSGHNTIGGASAGQGNLISGNTLNGIRITGDDSGSNDVLGNFIGVDKDGVFAIGNGADGVNLSVGASSNDIGGAGDGEGNLISGNLGNGVQMQSSGTDFNRVEGNLIGTDVSGAVALANSNYGVSISMSAYFNTVGGNSSGEGNVISGNAGGGVLVAGLSTDYTYVQGNLIGLDAGGVAGLPNGSHGVLIENGAKHSKIGGSTSGESNRIAHNSGDGVRLDGSLTTDNDIQRNSIYQNAGKGIELTSSANGGIVSPAITGTSLAGMSVSGTACASCTVEVFANPDTDEEGKIFLGSTTASGGGSFSLTVGSIPAPYLTATATDATDGTSEFSSVFTSTFGSLYLPLVNR